MNHTFGKRNYYSGREEGNYWSKEPAYKRKQNWRQNSEDEESPPPRAEKYKVNLFERFHSKPVFPLPEDFKFSKASQPPQFGRAQYDNVPNQGKLRIFTWNLNGLNCNVDRGTFQHFIDEADPDIICLNETKIDMEKIYRNRCYKAIPDGYEQYWNSADKKGYSGVAILTKIKPIQVLFGMQKPQHDTEGRVLTAEFSSFYLVAVYVPSSGADLMRHDYRTLEWDRDFMKYLSALGRRKQVIVTGDLNVAYNDLDVFPMENKRMMPGFTDAERKNFERWLKMGFADVFREMYPQRREYTFWFREGFRQKNQGWRLDYFVVSKGFMQYCEDVKIHPKYQGSDHVPVELKVDLTGGA